MADTYLNAENFTSTNFLRTEITTDAFVGESLSGIPPQTLAGESTYTGTCSTSSYRPAIRNLISGAPGKRALFAASVTSQPHYELDSDQIDWEALHASEARALPLASESDVVATCGTFQKDYLKWLREQGLGPGSVIEFDQVGTRLPVASLLQQQPHIVRETTGSDVSEFTLAPYYSGKSEAQASRALGMELFGCDEHLAEKYFNKRSFKAECEKLGIPVVEGLTCELENATNAQKLEAVVVRLLKSYPKLMLRGSEGANGSSLAMVEEASIKESLQSICRSGALEVLVEPFLSVIASPNDQWIIAGDGNIYHIGTSVQLFSNLKHRGNESSTFLQRDTRHYIQQTSSLIVEKMRDDGFRGIVGLDYVVTHDNRVYPIENNPRLNGSTFVYGILDRLQESFGEKLRSETFTWKFYRAVSPAQTFSELSAEMGDLFFDGSSPNGVFPFDCELLPVLGKWTPILFGEDRYHIERMEQELHRRGAVPLL